MTNESLSSNNPEKNNEEAAVVQLGLAKINPKLFGSKVKISETAREDLELELDKLIENPNKAPDAIDGAYVKYTGLKAETFFKFEKLKDKPKCTIETASAIALGRLIIELSDRVRAIAYAGVSKKKELSEIVDLISKDIEEATFPPSFGRDLDAIDNIDTLSPKEADGLRKTLQQVEKDIENIPSRYS